MVLQFPPADDQPVDRPAASKLKYKVVVGVGGLAGLFGIGSTLAANISLNNGGAVEFGQGVAQTAACDDDGFMVTPVTRYDNAHSMFRVTKLQVSGLNLTPVGWDTGTNALSTDTVGVAANPGKYFDNGQWKKTCDGVVLDFKAYSSDYAYSQYTLDGYDAADNEQPNPNSISSPLLWQQALNTDGTLQQGWNSDMAVVFQSPNIDSNYDFVANKWTGQSNQHAVAPTYNNAAGLFWVSHIRNSQSIDETFDLTWASQYQPAAAAISKITVESMKYFPANYRYIDDYYSGSSHHGVLGFAPGS
jgi:hypothetical protein